MAREFAQIKVSIWNDDEFLMLPTDAQLLYFTLLTSATLSHCGVADWRPNRIAAKAADWTPERVVTAARTLMDQLYIVTDEETEEVLLRSFIRHDGLMKQPKMAVSMALAVAGTASRTLRGVIVHELIRLHRDEPDLVGWARPQAAQLLSMASVDPAEIRAKPGVSEPLTGPLTLVEIENGLGVSKGSPTPAPAPAPTTSNQQPAPREFDHFWDLYPKRVGKDAARRAWVKALRRTTAGQILAGARRMSEDPNLPEKQFIPDPASWLNSGRWDDEPYPPRSNGAQPARAAPGARPSTTDQRVAAGLDLAGRLAAQEQTTPKPQLQAGDRYAAL